MDRPHQPVLLEEAIAALMVSADGTYVDGTFGRGGHSARILDALSPEGALLALDQDPAAAPAANQLLEKDPRFQFSAVNFRALAECAAPGTLQGVLLDLGVSSPQLDNPARGFSFTHDGPLDMRMNPDAGQSAASWLASTVSAWKVGMAKGKGSITPSVISMRSGPCDCAAAGAANDKQAASAPRIPLIII